MWWVETEETQWGGDGLGHNEIEWSGTHWKWYLIMWASVKKECEITLYEWLENMKISQSLFSYTVAKRHSLQKKKKVLLWWLSGKESTCNVGAPGDEGLILGFGRSPGGEHGNPLQYSCLENPMDRGAWQAIAHRVTKSQTWLKRLSIAQHTFIGGQSLNSFHHFLYYYS